MKGVLLVVALLLSGSTFACSEGMDLCSTVRKQLTEDLTFCEIDENVVNVEECFKYVKEEYKDFGEICNLN